MTSPADDEFTELVDATIPRVDLVDKAANGLPFLLAKRQDGAGLVDAATVRALIGKTADPDPQPANEQEQVTMSGSPAAIAKLIHEAAVRHAAPAAESADADVAKGAVVDGPTGPENDLDPTTILATPEGEQAPGSPMEPGSPAWEAVDAATARKWTAILSRAKSAVAVLAERELLEAASADRSDYDSALDLTDAECAIDYAISILAPFAVDEQAEVDCAADMVAAVGKALTDFDATSLDTIEALTQVTKAGRVLSARNEQAIRDAVDALQKVLASLPAPVPDSPEGGLPVAKEETAMQPQTEPSQTADTPDAVDKAADTENADAVDTATDPEAPDVVGKADQAPQIAVYDAKGRLVGIVAPESLIPVESPGEDDGEETPAAEEPAVEPAADDAAPPTDLNPAPAAEVGTPADEIGKNEHTDNETDNETDTDATSDADVLKSSIAGVVKAELDAYSATQQEVFAKQAEALAELASVVETLKGRIGTLEEQPAEPKVFTNGAVPPAVLRGQDRGATPLDRGRALEMKKSLYGAADATEQNRVAQDMQANAIAQLQSIHQQRA
ncbi:hypothetical protein [Streptomyces cavernae]|uniref:hypothetical protein n=1 Tax=Streptomyces cavernae TaxID=2259034 RepID=UPI000FEB6712|nr:hypothetical protein [Streptomyces cavernae]